MTFDTVNQDDLISAIECLSTEQLRKRNTAKWTLYGNDVIPAPVAEMDFPLAPVIREALMAAIARSETGYPPLGSGLPEATAIWLDRNWGVRVEPDRIRILPDILKGIDLAIKAFSRPGSAVVLSTPSYPPFFALPGGAGRETVEVPLLVKEGQFTFDLEGIDRALQGGAGTLILCNPYNPIGRVFTPSELNAVAEVVERNGARVIADEVHAPLVYRGIEFTSYSTVSEEAARHSVTLTSASKGWNVAGLKCAQIVLTNGDDLEVWNELPFLETHGASILGILANQVAYEAGGPWLQDVITYLDGNRHLLARLLAEHLPSVRYTVPEATYLAWLDCRALGLDDPAAFFLERARVAVNPGATFGANAKGYVRLNFATSREILGEIVERMGRATAAR